MTATAATARNEIFALIYAAVTAQVPAAKIVWEGTLVPADQMPTSDETWVRVSLRHVTGEQASLAGVDGVRRWNRTGFVSAQCFAPLASGGIQAATELARVVRDALQGKTTASQIWFRNPRINEVGEDRDWFQVNATIDFNYDELR